MRRVDALLAAATNVESTYFAIGGATPTARVSKRQDFGICLCDFEHPVCNFAITRDMTAESGIELAQIARQRRYMNVYLLPGTQTDRSAKLLRHAGFRRHYRMAVMEASVDALPGNVHLNVAMNERERREIAEFMVEMFFDRQPMDVQCRIAEATAFSTCPLYRVESDGRRVGTLLLTEEAGVMGLYNLCIDPRLRRAGYGAAAVRACLARAHLNGTPVTLQCDRALVPWYQSLGFETIGLLDAFSLTRS